jgi:hypothetical protein
MNIVHAITGVTLFVFAGDNPWDIEKVKLGSWSRGESYIEDILQVWYMYYITFGNSHYLSDCVYINLFSF